MNRRTAVVSLLVVSAIGAVIAWAWATAPGQPNLLLVTLDTTRADHLSAYGYVRPTTPNLELFAVKCQRFQDAWAPMATTLPSHTSLLTGTWPLEHGVLANVEHGGRRTLPSDQLVSVAQLFADAGYATAAFVSATPLKPGTGIERGFQTFDAPERNTRRAKPVTDAALRWLRRHRKRPFFAWVHYYDPHGPFREGEPSRFPTDEAVLAWREERAIPEVSHRTGGAELATAAAQDGYDGELRDMDDQLGRLFEQLETWGLDDDTVVVVVADHGEGLGQHDVGGHGHVWKEQLSVPLLVRVPWRPPRAYPQPISLVDVFPTVLQWMNVPGKEAWLARVSGRDGRSAGTGPLLGLSSDRQTSLGVPEQVSLTLGSVRSVRLGDHLAVYDLATDPHELDDRADVLPFHREILVQMEAEVAAAQRARGALFGTGGTVELGVDERGALEELGYLAPDGPAE